MLRKPESPPFYPPHTHTSTGCETAALGSLGRGETLKTTHRRTAERAPRPDKNAAAVIRQSLATAAAKFSPSVAACLRVVRAWVGGTKAGKKSRTWGCFLEQVAVQNESVMTGDKQMKAAVEAVEADQGSRRCMTITFPGCGINTLSYTLCSGLLLRSFGISRF